MSVTLVMYSRVLSTVCVAHARVQRSQPLSRTSVVTRCRCTLSHRATLGWTYFIPHRTLNRARVNLTLIAPSVTLSYVQHTSRFRYSINTSVESAVHTHLETATVKV